LLDFRDIDGKAYLDKLRAAMQGAANTLPAHEAYIERHCQAI
jgi:hypothetical protein